MTAVWVVDPWRRLAFSVTADGALDPIGEVLTVAGTEVRVPVSEMFAELDELEARG